MKMKLTLTRHDLTVAMKDYLEKNGFCILNDFSVYLEYNPGDGISHPSTTEILVTGVTK